MQLLSTSGGEHAGNVLYIFFLFFLNTYEYICIVLTAHQYFLYYLLSFYYLYILINDIYITIKRLQVPLSKALSLSSCRSSRLCLYWVNLTHHMLWKQCLFIFCIVIVCTGAFCLNVFTCDGAGGDSLEMCLLSLLFWHVSYWIPCTNSWAFLAYFVTQHFLILVKYGPKIRFTSYLQDLFIQEMLASRFELVYWLISWKHLVFIIFFGAAFVPVCLLPADCLQVRITWPWPWISSESPLTSDSVTSSIFWICLCTASLSLSSFLWASLSLSRSLWYSSFLLWRPFLSSCSCCSCCCTSSSCSGGEQSGIYWKGTKD